MTALRLKITSLLLILLALPAFGRDAASLTAGASLNAKPSIQSLPYTFDGYKNYWARDAWQWNTARGLFAQSQQSAEAALWAMEEEIGNQFMLEELWVQPGFMQRLAAAEFATLEHPSAEEFSAEASANILVSVTDLDAITKDLVAKLPEEWQFRRNRAFYLEDAEGTVFVLASHYPAEIHRLREVVEQTLAVVKQYDFHRGLAGIVSNYVHITPGVDRDPFELIQIARSLGCDWLSVNGYNDWMTAGPVNRALDEIGDPFLFISGQSVSNGAIYGIDRYPDVQDNTIEECLDWAAEKGGVLFAGLSGVGKDYESRLDGFLVSSPENVEQVMELGVPFVTTAGDIERSVPRTMVAFLEKGTALTQENLFAAIKARRTVAVFPEGVVAGPEDLVTAVRFLLLEGNVLSEKINGPLRVKSEITAGMLYTKIVNTGSRMVSAKVTYSPASGVAMPSSANAPISAPVQPGQLHNLPPVPLRFLPEGNGRHNLVGITVSEQSPEGELIPAARGLAYTKIPPAVSFHTLRYDAPGQVTYPVSIWNSSSADTVSLRFRVKRADSGETIHEADRLLKAVPREELREEISFEAPAGDYTIEASVSTTDGLMGTETGQLAIREAPGEVRVFEEDMDGDGVPEIIMESESVRVAVLMEGGRVMEYIIKETGENIFFKLWPETPPLHGTIGGTRPFYPYGGLEEFIGYPYIGGHIVYRHEVLQDSGDKGRVRVWANIHGSKISKDYTLYAGGPVLEATYQFQDMTPTIHTMGINPLFELGPSTGPEDHYYFPEEEIVETRPELERYYGRACFPVEGWAAGEDPEAKTSLVIGYPVNDAVYLHLWNNHPDNTPTPYYYTEIQPWLQFDHGTTTYFSYYVLGSSSDWKSLVDTFRAAGLVTTRKNPEPWDY